MLTQQSRDSGLNQIRLAIQAHNNRRSAPPAPVSALIQPSQSSAAVLKPSNVPKMGTAKMHKVLDQFRHDTHNMVPLQKTASGPTVQPKTTAATMRFLNGSSTGATNHSKQSSDLGSKINSKLTSKHTSKPSSITSEKHHTAVSGVNLNKSNSSLHKSRLADVKPRYLEPRKVVQPPELKPNKSGSNFSSRTASPSVVRRTKRSDSKASQESNISLDSLTSPNVKKGSVSSRNTSKESLTSHDRVRIHPNKRQVPVANGTRIPTKPKPSSGSSSHSSSIATNHRLISVRSISSNKSKSSDASPNSVTNHKSFFTPRSREILSKRAIEEKQKIENAINSATTARERNKLRAQLGIRPMVTAPVVTRVSPSTAPKLLRKLDSTTREKNLKNIAKKHESENIEGEKDEATVTASEVAVEETIVYSRLERSSTFCKETSDNPDIVQID